MLITKVRLDQVHPHPHNIRRDVGDVTELAESFKTSGLLQPIVVAPDSRNVGMCQACSTVAEKSGLGALLVTHKPKGAKTFCGADEASLPLFTLIAGHRRLAAAKVCDWPQIDVVVRDDLNTEAKQIETMAIENLQRTNLSPAEEARGYQQLLDLGYTPQKIAKQTGRNVKTVKLRIGLTKLSQIATDKLHTGQITIEQAEVLASFAKDPKAYKELEKSIGTNNFAYQVQAVKAKQAKEAERTKLFEQLKAEGTAIVKVAHGYPWNSTEKPLRELGIEPADHALCAGHGATVVDGYPKARIDYLCTNPVANGHREAAPERDQMADRAPRRNDVDYQAQRDALNVAQAARREFVASHLKRQRLSGPVEVALLRMSLLRRAEQLFLDDIENSDMLAALLSLDFTDLEDEARLAHFAAHLDQLVDVAHLLKVLLAVESIEADPGTWSNWRDAYVPAFFALLTQAGYEVSDVERAELDTAHPPVTLTNLGADGEPIEDVVPVGEFADAI